MKVAIYCRLSEEDRNKQFETDAINGDYIEPRVTDEKLKRIVEETGNEK